MKKISVLVLIIVIIFSAIKIVPHFKANEISCKLDGQSCPTEILTKLDPLKSKYIVQIEDNLIQNLLSPYQVSSVKIIPPDKVTISLKLPEAAVVINIAGTTFLSTSNSQILGIGSDNLPKVYSNGGSFPIIGEVIKDFNLNRAVKLAAALKAVGFSQPEVWLEGANFEVKNISSARIYSESKQDPDQTAAALQRLLGKSTIEGRVPVQIDLRFAQPVVTY